MSKRRHNFQRNQQILTTKRDPVREAELLSRPTQDFSNEPVIRAFIDRMATATDEEAARLALALQKFLRGDASLLANDSDPEAQATIQRTLAQAEKVDEYAKKWEEDREGFIEEMDRLREMNTPVGEKKDKTIATGVSQYQDAVQRARIERDQRRLQLSYELEHGPKEMVHVEGQQIQTTVQGAVQMVTLPEEIRIMNKRFVYPPGDHLMPRPVAQRYREMLRGRAENAARRKAMSLGINKSYNNVEAENRRIDQEFGSKRDALPLMQEE